MDNYQEYLRLAEIYQAYNLVNRFHDENHHGNALGELFNESVFNAAKFLVKNLERRSPNGVNIVYV